MSKLKLGLHANSDVREGERITVDLKRVTLSQLRSIFAPFITSCTDFYLNGVEILDDE